MGGMGDGNGGDGCETEAVVTRFLDDALLAATSVVHPEHGDYNQSFDDMHLKMKRSGFRGDRLSVWGIQGLHLMSCLDIDIDALFVEISQLSKIKSLLFGELPNLDKQQTKEFLARHSLSSLVTDLQMEADYMNRMMRNASHRCVFKAEQQMHSVRDQEVYAAHVQAAEETDEDFLDNFS